MSKFGHYHVYGVVTELNVGTAIGNGVAIGTGSSAEVPPIEPPVTGVPPGPFNNQTGDFTIEWDAVPDASGSTEDVVMGLSDGATTALTAMACIARFYTAGNIDARNGNAYAATTTVPYTAGQSYHFRMVVRISSHTYDVFVTPQGQSEVKLASNFAFRSEQASIAQLNCLDSIATQGGATLTNMIEPPPQPQAPPVVTNGSFNLSTSGSGFAAGAVVGTMSASNNPTQWNITSGNASGYYAIDNAGKITVTAAGVSGLGNQSGTSTLACSAVNAGGAGSGTATVSYKPAATSGSFPTASDTGVPPGTVLTPSGSITISTDGQTVSGLDITGTIGIKASNVTVENCRLKIGSASAPFGINITGGTNNLIKNCTLIGFGAGATVNQYGVCLQVKTALTIDGCNFSYWGHSITPYGGCGNPLIIQNCYGDHMDNWADTHYEHIYLGGGDAAGHSVTIRNCTWINERNYTATIFLKTDSGPIMNVTIDGNHLVGGGWNLYVQQTTHPITGVVVTNNAMGKGLQGNGYCYPGAVVDVWSGNYDDVTGATVPKY
jgi:hypothetical protein